MASSDTLLVFTALHNSPPATNAATIDLRNQHPVLDFDAATDEGAIFGAVLPRNYAGGGITASIIWMASTGSSDACVWLGAFERHQDDAFDLDADGFASDQEVDAAAPIVVGETSYDDMAFTDGAQIDSLAVGESFRFRLKRDAGDTDDILAGDAELLRIELRET